jgi:hypothetical protein
MPPIPAVLLLELTVFLFAWFPSRLQCRAFIIDFLLTISQRPAGVNPQSNQIPRHRGTEVPKVAFGERTSQRFEERHYADRAQRRTARIWASMAGRAVVAGLDGAVITYITGALFLRATDGKARRRDNLFPGSR